ncbi:SMG6 [Branchiostoma lanceolatum]|uniref:SMG6 protein n=1 Tax=Branchiostoma lanceolatum TaxID=7740 RepID=A0A8J9YZ79_BRALA|nr:SMG6 [Branchiostoma lanceolatum]
MADVSSLRVVRINEEQLQQTAQCHRGKASSGPSVLSSHVGSGAGHTEQVRKPPRRPAMAIYQPGISRLARKKSGSTDSGEDSSSKVTLQGCKTTRRTGTDGGCKVLSKTGDNDEVSVDVCTCDVQHKSYRERATSLGNSKHNSENCSCSMTPETLLAINSSDDISSSCSTLEEARDELKKVAEGSVCRNQAKTGQFISTSSNEDSPTKVSKSSGGVKTEKEDVFSNDHLHDDVGLGSKEAQPSTTHQPRRAQLSSTGSYQNIQSRGIIHLPPDISLHTHQADKQGTRPYLGEDNKRLFDPHKSAEIFHLTVKSEHNRPVARQVSKPRHHPSQSELCHHDVFSRGASHVQGNVQDRLPTCRYSHDVHVCLQHSIATNEDYHEFTDTNTTGTNSEKWQHVLQQAEALAADLRLHLSQGVPDNQHVVVTLHLQSQIQTCYESLILQDPEFASKHNIDQTLWKNSFYNIIEAFRGYLPGHQMKESLHNLLALIDKGASFYTDLLQKLQRKHKFNLDAYTYHLRTEPPARNVKLALLIAQRILICLGDISRYREQATGSANFGKARSFYLKAQRLYPNNGHPYNQLAILAIYTRRKMDAVYFYMRSLAASNPFVTARESLVTLFEEVRRKVTQMEGKKKATQDSHQGKSDEKWPKVRRHYPQKSSALRQEIWILPPQLRKSQKTSLVSSLGLQPSSRTPSELVKSFELSFLHTHGKLFTKTGMETFSAVVSQTLHEFQSLLQLSPSSIGNMKLLQVMGINMFAISNCASSDVWAEGIMSPLQDCAVRLGMDMFGLMVTTAAHNLQQQRRSATRDSGQAEGKSNAELQELLPSLKVWADWMTCHQFTWNPTTNTYSSSPVANTWTALADLCNELEESDSSTVTLEDEHREDLEPVLLEEDFHLAGFQPLSSQIISGVKYASPSSVQKGIAQDILRKKSLQLFGQYLCGLERPILVWEHGKHVSTVPSNHDAEDTAEKLNLEAGNPIEEDIIIEAYTEEEEMDVESCDMTRGSFKELKAKRDLLAKLLEEKEKRKSHIEAVLDDHTSAVEMEVEVVPAFLIPDTNSFIDNLHGLKRLILCQMFTVVVPLVVINELDGLARGSKPGLDKTSGHAQKLQQGAMLAVQFLEDQFSHHDSHLRALTSKGTSLDTIAFRNEDMPGHQGNNDDVILSCCLHFCHDVAKDYMPTKRGEPIRLKRDVVLLTDDRNLHLKAHTHNVPVKEIQEFIHWSGL